jgi:predicted kinase
MILLSAIPGSGKSTWARKYQEEHPNTFIVSSDEIRVRLFGKVNDFRDEPRVWKTYLDDINRYAETYEDVTVIADATNLQNKYRKMYREGTPKFDRHVLVLFDLPYEICLIQNQMRTPDRIVPRSGMDRLKAEMEQPTPEIIKMYDEYVVVHDFVSKTALEQEKKAIR